MFDIYRQGREIEKRERGGKARKEETEGHEKKAEYRACQFSGRSNREDIARKKDIVEN